MGDETDRLTEPDPTPWVVQDGRVRAQRGQPDGLRWRMYLISDVCLHAVDLTDFCDQCVADITYLEGVRT
jgi:hypothetical protein